MQLEGIGIAGYRSFGADMQYFGPLTKVNLIAGPNNSGKSNVLRFVDGPLAPLCAALGSGRVGNAIGALDLHRPDQPGLRFAIGVRLDGELYQTMARGLGRSGAGSVLGRAIEPLAGADDVVWFDFTLSQNKDSVVLAPDWIRDSLPVLPHAAWESLCLELNHTGGSLQHMVEAVVHSLARSYLRPPKVALIPAVREIGTGGINGSVPSFAGADIIARLAELQNPAIHELETKRGQFAAINDFIKAVTDVPNAEIEIPHSRDTIHVTLGSHVLPLEHLGTGIHEVTMLAAFSTLLENQIVCIEEPELHLHPLLQRKLLNHLAERTSNQYLITTHSAHLLDQPGASVFHVRWDGHESRVNRAAVPAQRVALCADLGYRPSDLLQANAVIWVEGPSDRLYIRHWLAAVAPALKEGIHYSLMFYGGRLLSHLSADDVEVSDFISLRRINQWLSVVIDSDRASARAKINATKQRVKTELNAGPGLAWVTRGREIENYVPDDLLWAAIAKVHRDATRVAAPGDCYADQMTIRTRRGLTQADKVKVAHHVVAEPADLSLLDLRARVEDLAAFVEAANGLSSSRVTGR